MVKKRSFGRVSDPLKKASKPVGPNRTLAILATRFPRADLFRCSEFLGLDRTLTCRACHQQLAVRRKEARDTQGSFGTPTSSVFWQILAFSDSSLGYLTLLYYSSFTVVTVPYLPLMAKSRNMSP